MGQVKNKDDETSFRLQCKCLLCEKSEYYQKKCPISKENNISRIK